MTPVRRIRRRAAVDAAHAASSWPADIPPLLRRIYAARGAHDADAARPRLAALLPPDGLLDLDRATTLLAAAIEGGRRILVVGDFDADGATACALAVRGLRMLGAGDVLHAVPNRMVHGYGLSPALVAELAPLRPDLLVTVDHGIACHAGIAAAKALGWQVLVTDHHLPGERLPAADAIVNPNRSGDGFAGKSLVGVGVMFYVLLALRARLRATGRLDGKGPDLAQLLDLVAVGTVADLAPLDANNRALVAAGLRRLRARQGCAGLMALVEVAGRRAESLVAADIGFAVGPRLNAAGRLEDMALGIECLLCDDPGRARELAQRLDAINRERRDVQQSMLDEAERALSAKLLDGSGLDGQGTTSICAFDPGWHPGVVGLVASKLKERLHRPVVAFAPGEPGSSSLRGSARSIPGFHVRDALAAIDALHPGLIERFGGHAMAAGLTLDAAHLDAFQAAFEVHAGAMLDAATLQATLDSDGALAPHEFDRAHAEALRDGGPWGQAFPEPLFDGEFELADWRVVGERHLRMTLRAEGLRTPLAAIQFGGWRGDPPPARARLAYRLQPDDYRGGAAIQLLVEHLEAC
ncbi:single-stranded-DNA-specific exonuclease RecJ [Luteimonas sp. Sa2BVA3]|uniref:Single-stranded-DNA-specific exonuclease RecJ n=1 Tax=Luteimonas colneyensis TaxID=2762230 RepID=A0ABR8UF09_9GAMM|nr:single-stranded-DNA-specific exonuclease RecJ [Luteimonas colneyensis]